MPHPRLPLLPVFLPRRPFASQKSLVQNFDQPQLQSIYHRHNQQCRTFFTPLVQETANLLTTSASLLPVPTPWYLVLPIFAIFLRTSTTLPLTIYSRKVCIRLVQLQPLMSAWGRVLGSQAARKSRKRQVGGVDGGIAENLSPHDWEVRTRQATTKTRDDLAKRWGCQAWKKYVSMGQIPIWAVASFTIRGISTEHSSSATTAAGIGTPPSPPQELSGASSAGNAIEGEIGEVISEPGYIQSLLDSIPLQESLSTGGALWFPDLLSPDPLYLFPIALSLSMFANSEFQALQYPPTTPRSKVIRQLLKLFSLAIIPITMQTPVALTLYWLSSSLYSLAQNIFLHHVYPLPKAIKPCNPKTLIGMEAGKEKGITGL